MTFSVQLVGSQPLLENIARCFQGDFARFRKIGDDWFLESSLFNPCIAPADVHPIADKLLSLIHSVTAIYAQLFSPFEVGYVQAFNDDGVPAGRAIRAFQRIQVYSAEGLREIQNLAEGQPLGSIVVGAATRDAALEAALALMGDGYDLDWPQLYNILEFLGGETVIVGRRWATRKQIRKFRQTANHYRHLGSPKDYPLPFDPPSEAEARSLVLDLLKKWISERM